MPARRGARTRTPFSGTLGKQREETRLRHPGRRERAPYADICGEEADDAVCCGCPPGTGPKRWWRIKRSSGVPGSAGYRIPPDSRCFRERRIAPTIARSRRRRACLLLDEELHDLQRLLTARRWPSPTERPRSPGLLFTAFCKTLYLARALPFHRARPSKASSVRTS